MPRPPPPAELSARDLAVATGGFHGLAQVGEGGFGKVYRAMLHHRPVAIKVMTADGLQGAAEFDTERRLLGSLSHAHLVRLLGVCVSSSPPLRGLVYELMPGGSVEEHLATRQAGRCVLPWWLRLRLAAQIAAALAYLHGLPASEGGAVIHRDIKPANMFLDGRLNAKLGDFGLAVRAGPDGAALPASSAGGAPRGEVDVVGTFAYLAPETRCAGKHSTRGDVYALGVSLLQLATGQLERLHDLVARVRAGLAAGDAAGLLDDSAGDWDEAAGRRLLCLGLWAAAADADARPSCQLLAGELAKLWLAAEQARRAQGGGGGSASSAGSAGSASAPAAAAVAHTQAALAAAAWQQQPAAGWPGSGGGGGFWRFLTSSVQQLGR